MKNHKIARPSAGQRRAAKQSKTAAISPLCSRCSLWQKFVYIRGSNNL
ncbi:MAG: hypothetical protein ACYSO4_07655 [Planctomycetota bacterium]|jgi:hypothetical protein